MNLCSSICKRSMNGIDGESSRRQSSMSSCCVCRYDHITHLDMCASSTAYWLRRGRIFNGLQNGAYLISKWTCLSLTDDGDERHESQEEGRGEDPGHGVGRVRRRRRRVLVRLCRGNGAQVGCKLHRLIPLRDHSVSRRHSDTTTGQTCKKELRELVKKRCKLGRTWNSFLQSA